MGEGRRGGGERLAALYLITSNKRYSPPPLFFLPLIFLLFPPSLSLFFSVSFYLPCPSTYFVLPLLYFVSLLHFLSFLQYFRVANVLTCVILKRSISLATFHLPEIRLTRSLFLSPSRSVPKTNIDHLQSGRESNKRPPLAWESCGVTQEFARPPLLRAIAKLMAFTPITLITQPYVNFSTGIVRKLG